MRYGSFDDLHREYVITQPDTPLPWINYLGAEEFFGLISNTAGGYTFYRDARLRRLTRYRYNNVPLDTGGRMIYLRDDQTGEFWSPAWQPARAPLDSYTCRHGLGYTTIQSARSSISADLRFFIPLAENLEVWQVSLTNARSQPAEISLFACVEFCLWDAWDDATNFQRNFSIGEVEVEDGVIYHKTEYRERRDHFAYFASWPRSDGVETQREAFLGPYRGWDSPQAVEAGQLANSIAHGWAPVGAHHLRLALAPGETRQVIFLLGYTENPPEHKYVPGTSQADKRLARQALDRFQTHLAVERAFADLAAYWNDLLSVCQVETCDEHTNRIVNIWNAYQCMVTFNLSRSASFFESGIGRGIGFRDSNQDLLGFVHMVPDRARQRILDLASTQLETGGAYHQYQPLTKRGNEMVGSGFNDDPLWLVLAAAAYVKETGDCSILQEPAPFDSRPGSEQPLYEHLKRSLQYTLDRLGPHGLPLIGRADWNDCLNLNTFSQTPGESFQTAPHAAGEVAESVFIAGLFVLAAREMADLSAHCGWPADAQAFNLQAEQMKLAVEQHGWDGEWFLRAYDAYGQKVGSLDCAEGQIFIEPQGMCVMAGIGLSDGRAAKSLEAVAERLSTPHGLLLQQPAYSRYYLNLGEISSYPPGYKENASIFCHTNPWMMIAEAVAGSRDRAFDYYRRINPSAREDLSEMHRCEPYVYAQMIAGRDAPTHGEAKNSWLTGTAAWNYVAITQWILGIRPGYNGLVVAPAIPDDWQGFTARRIFRGVTYHISVIREGPGRQVSLIVDGRPVEGDQVPLPPPGQTEVTVEARLG